MHFLLGLLPFPFHLSEYIMHQPQQPYAPKGGKTLRGWRGSLYVIVLIWTIVAFAIFKSDQPKRGNSESPCSHFPDDCTHTAPFVFDSLYSLLKQWPSTYAPNGHSIAAGVIPAHTALYHAQGYPGLPRKPTFYAFDE